MTDLVPTDIDSIELHDAALRHAEGGGAIPFEWQQHLHGLGQIAPPPEIPWYRQPTYLGIVGLGVLAVGVVMYMATSKE